MIALAALLLTPAAAMQRGWSFEVEGRVGGGVGQHLVPPCCPSSRRLVWGGLAGGLEASPRPPGGARLLLSAQADLRLGQLDTPGGGNDTGAVFHAANTCVGLDSRWFGIEGGLYETSRPNAAIRRVLPSAAIWGGSRASFWVSLHLLDEPSCFLPTCVLGLSYGVVIRDVLVLENGFSLGPDKGRA
jgi:hypothetical protein